MAELEAEEGLQPAPLTLTLRLRTAQHPHFLSILEDLKTCCSAFHGLLVTIILTSTWDEMMREKENGLSMLVRKKGGRKGGKGLQRRERERRERRNCLVVAVGD